MAGMTVRLAAVGVAVVGLASIPTAQEANEAVLMLKQHESWVWALGIALIWADLGPFGR